MANSMRNGPDERGHFGIFGGRYVAETLMPLKQELFALSGMKMKTWTMGDIREVEGRQVAYKMVIADELKQGSKTVITVDDVTFGVELEAEVFSRRWLERR